MIKYQKPSKKRSVSRAGVSTKSNYTPSGLFDINFGYTTIDLKGADTFGKVNLLQAEGHLDTGANIFLDFKYWMADSNSSELTSTSKSQAGNPEIILGFNWLSFGNGGDTTNIDLLMGARLKASNSELGSTRTDKIVGISTVKRFEQFALGLSYRLNIAGTPDGEKELVIGNFQKFCCNLRLAHLKGYSV